MKRIIFASAIVITAGLAAHAQADMLALWELNGNAIDSVGVNHGSEYGDASYVGGVFAQALALDGHDNQQTSCQIR